MCKQKQITLSSRVPENNRGRIARRCQGHFNPSVHREQGEGLRSKRMAHDQPPYWCHGKAGASRESCGSSGEVSGALHPRAGGKEDAPAAPCPVSGPAHRESPGQMRKSPGERNRSDQRPEKHDTQGKAGKSQVIQSGEVKTERGFNTTIKSQRVLTWRMEIDWSRWPPERAMVLNCRSGWRIRTNF